MATEKQWRFVVSRALAALALAAMGCGGSAAALCEKVQECRGGNDSDLDACVAQMNGAMQIAATYDCSDQYAKYADCVETKGTCSGKQLVAECGDEDEALRTCQNQAMVDH